MTPNPTNLSEYPDSDSDSDSRYHDANEAPCVVAELNDDRFYDPFDPETIEQIRQLRAQVLNQAPPQQPIPPVPYVIAQAQEQPEEPASAPLIPQSHRRRRTTGSICTNGCVGICTCIAMMAAGGALLGFISWGAATCMGVSGPVSAVN